MHSPRTSTKTLLHMLPRRVAANDLHRRLTWLSLGRAICLPGSGEGGEGRVAGGRGGKGGKGLCVCFQRGDDIRSEFSFEYEN